jgi:hypothetical protein
MGGGLHIKNACLCSQFSVLNYDNIYASINPSVL